MPNQRAVLVIDDDADFTEFVKIILESAGYDVLVAHDADAGLELARQAQPRLALVDVMMSYILDGLNLIQTMRMDPRCCQIPIILVSAIVSADQDGLLPPGEELGCAAFMSKPLEPRALLRTIAKVLEET
ncbi:MAG: response regulator transcription factor [Chloroflexi bacterium]|nr:response regulator transcription factor [Chloroflexota bacterium]